MYAMQKKFFAVRHLVGEWCKSGSLRELMKFGIKYNFGGSQAAQGQEELTPSDRFAEIAQRLPDAASPEMVSQKFPGLFIEEWGRFFSRLSDEGVGGCHLDEELPRFLREVFGGDLS